MLVTACLRSRVGWHHTSRAKCLAVSTVIYHYNIDSQTPLPLSPYPRQLHPLQRLLDSLPTHAMGHWRWEPQSHATVTLCYPARPCFSHWRAVPSNWKVISESAG